MMYRIYICSVSDLEACTIVCDVVSIDDKMIPLLQRNILLKLQFQTFRRNRKYTRRKQSERKNFPS